MSSKITKEHFPVVLRRFRHDAGLTQEQLSERIGISTSYFGMMEVGQRWPNVDMLFRIADALEVAPDVLVKALDVERRKS